ncbi:hypothetical protein HDU99_002650 [Rhizoclosmatium hyalinum]|nr:hypothetical protein HDU99_002650 [Rhizoclosmatium hyalinum]
MSESSMTAYDILNIDESDNLATVEGNYVVLGYKNRRDKTHFKALAIAYLIVTTDRQNYNDSLNDGLKYQKPRHIRECNPEEVYETVFNQVAIDVDALLNDSKKTHLNGVVGALAGGVFGFIVAGPVGAIGGAFAGGAAGNIRDIHGKSPYEIFKTLDKKDKKKIIDAIIFLLSAF